MQLKFQKKKGKNNWKGENFKTKKEVQMTNGWIIIKWRHKKMDSPFCHILLRAFISCVHLQHVTSFMDEPKCKINNKLVNILATILLIYGTNIDNLRIRNSV